MQGEVLEWVGGGFVHNHFRIDDLVDSIPSEEVGTEMSVYMKRYTDGSFSLRAISAYLFDMFNQQMLITDTQHPSYVLSDDYDDLEDKDKVQFYNPRVVEQTRDLLTMCIIERMRIIRRFDDLSHVLSGVEVDILTSKGGLNVHNEGLRGLDYVTASFHSSLWYAAGNPTPNIATCMSMYNYVVDNPNVDAISHPTLYIPDPTKSLMTAKDWVELFRNMRERQVAFEVNLDSTNLAYKNGSNLDRDLIVLALKEGVPIVIGFDFHYMADWGVHPSPRMILGEEDTRRLFLEHQSNGGINRLLSRVLGNIQTLKQLGLQPENIVNSNKNIFTNWLSQRKP